MYQLLLPLTLLNTYMGYISGENILVVMPLPARSHFKSFQPLLEELVTRGHNMTLISGHKLGENLRGKYRHVDVKNYFSEMKINFAQMRQQSRLYNLIFSSERIIEYDEHVLKDEHIQQLITSEEENLRFDSVIVELFFMDVFLAFGHRFKAPIIGLSAQNLISFYGWYSGNPITPSYIPNLFVPFTDEMTFVERLLNVFYTGITGFYYEYFAIPKHQKQMETYFHFDEEIKETPTIKNLLKNVSLILVNSHYAFGYPKPHLPNVIQTAGLHITEPAPLSGNIEKFMSEAAHGVIYVSLGSLIQPDDVQPLGRAFLGALQDLPQKVIFKWNAKLLPYIPSNFLVQEWVPQTSILKHSKCRLFITHGGLHSLIESVNYSVPLIGVPFFTDQQHNMALIEYLGIGKKLNIDFKESHLSSAVNEILSDPKYYENVKLRSEKFNDRIVSPLNTAVYWIEYIMRHDDISHMKSTSAQLEWYQYFLVDVWICLIAVISLAISVIYLSLKFALNEIRNIVQSTNAATLNNKSMKTDNKKYIKTS